MKKSFTFAFLLFVSTMLSFGQIEIKRVGTFILFKQNNSSYFISETSISSITIEKEKTDDRLQNPKQSPSTAGHSDSDQSDKQASKAQTKINVYTTQKQDAQTSQPGNPNIRPYSMASALDCKTYSFVIDESEAAAYLEKISMVLSTKKPSL